MRKSRVIQKWSRNEPAMCIALAFTDPATAELASLLGFDCLWIDLEHHPRSVETVGELIRASRIGISDVIARPAKGELMRMGRMLEAGAAGIMYPRCEHEDEAAAVVKAAKFPPLGRRGVDTGSADAPFASMAVKPYIEMANAQTFILVQIEDPESLERVEKIAAVPGVDGIFFGPGDFSVAAGIPDQWDHPLLAKAAERVANATKAAGKRWGMPSLGMEHTKRILSLGASFVTCGSDMFLLKTALEEVQAKFAPLGLSCENQLGLSSFQT